MAKQIGVYICHCGTNISATVDCQELVQFFGALPGVKVARDYRHRSGGYRRLLTPNA
jgi:heterodisulfide reductase subunit A